MNAARIGGSKAEMVTGACSGAGKGRLMVVARAAPPSIHLLRRAVTRTAVTGEGHRPVNQASFCRLRAERLCAGLAGHGLSCGIPREAGERVKRSECVLFNGSRAMLGAVAAAFSGLQVLHITARKEGPRARLTVRGRETGPRSRPVGPRRTAACRRFRPDHHRQFRLVGGFCQKLPHRFDHKEIAP